MQNQTTMSELSWSQLEEVGGGYEVSPEWGVSTGVATAFTAAAATAASPFLAGALAAAGIAAAGAAIYYAMSDDDHTASP